MIKGLFGYKWLYYLLHFVSKLLVNQFVIVLVVKFDHLSHYLILVIVNSYIIFFCDLVLRRKWFARLYS